ncbi:MAG: chemotaxis protein CheW [Halioglobus sp.]
MNNFQSHSAETTLQFEDGLDQYLTFMLADEEYGVDILRVQEIKGWDGVTPMPNMPNFILGVINLRGTVVPIVDLRAHFGLPDVEFGETTVVIVVRVSGDEDSSERTMGVVVDAVSEVHNIATGQLKPAPDFAGACSTDSIKGLVPQDDNMLILLDIDRLMNREVLSALAQQETELTQPAANTALV